jgi:hypothetical protein
LLRLISLPSSLDKLNLIWLQRVESRLGIGGVATHELLFCESRFNLGNTLMRLPRKLRLDSAPSANDQVVYKDDHSSRQQEMNQARTAAYSQAKAQ